MGKAEAVLLGDNDRTTINRFVGSFEHSQFLQSFEWGQFQAALGREVVRIGFFESGDKGGFLHGSALLVKHPLPFGMYYWYCPRGPILANEALWQTFFDFMKQQNALFVRFEPVLKAPPTARKVKSVQPALTSLLELPNVSFDALKVRMHPKTRYNIHVAERKGVAVKRYIKPEGRAVEEFITLVKQTSKRQGFKAYSGAYYRTLCAVLGGTQMNLFTAYIKNTPIASSMVMFFGDTATYLHGGSSSADKNLMAPYLVQWEAIKAAKDAGFRYYDFWGIALSDAVSHPLSGVARFKNGFGGSPHAYPGKFEMPFSPLKYKLLCLAKKFR